MFRSILVLILCLAMVSCTAIQAPMSPGGSKVITKTLPSGETITEYNGNSFTTDSMMSAVNGCRAYVQAKEENRQALAMSINDDQLKAMVVVHGQVTDMVSQVWGSDLCEPGTNEFDAYIAYAEQQGAINRSMIEVGGGVLKTGLIAGFTWAGVDSIMGAVGTRAGGDMITSGANTTKDGDVSSGSTTSIQTQAVNRNTGDIDQNPEVSPETATEELPEGFVAPGCSAESRAAGRC